MKRFAAAAVLAGLSALAAAQDWGDVRDEYSKDYAESKALCRQLKRFEPPAADRPSAAAARTLKGCDSEALYYGIGVKRDPDKARQCAFLEAQKPVEQQAVFGGRTMLMTIYANGVGAKRNLDVAAHLACGIEGAPAETDGRVRHLTELKAKRWTGSDFHYCDDITSGFAMGHCAGQSARIGSVERDSKLERLTSGWTPAERKGFEAVKSAHAAYVDARGSGEIDLMGTDRAALQIGAEEQLKDELLETLQRLSAGRAPVFSRAAFAAEDAKLNAAYRKRLAGIEPVDSPGAVTKAGVRGAQRAWLRYRDAFLAFAAVKFPNVTRDSLAAWLTQKRTAMLSEE